MIYYRCKKAVNHPPNLLQGAQMYLLPTIYRFTVGIGFLSMKHLHPAYLFWMRNQWARTVTCLMARQCSLHKWTWTWSISWVGISFQFYNKRIALLNFCYRGWNWGGLNGECQCSSLPSLTLVVSPSSYNQSEMCDALVYPIVRHISILWTEHL